jgi:hypothetical protein
MIDIELSAILGQEIDLDSEQIKKLNDYLDKNIALRCVNLLNSFIDLDPRTVNTLVQQYTVCSPMLADSTAYIVKLSDVYAINILGILQGISGQRYWIKPVPNELVGINSVSTINRFEIHTVYEKEKE